MGIAPQVRARSTNTLRTKRSASSVVQAATDIAQAAPMASIVTVTAGTSAFGVALPQRGIAPQAQAKFTKSKRQAKMDYNLDRKVVINYDTEFNSLYKWCLNEFDENNKKIGTDLIPWHWSFYFIGSSFKVVRSVSIEHEVQDDGEEKNTVKQNTRIVGTLHSGFCRDGVNLDDDVKFSMFGTGRRIKDFQVCIYQVESDDREACRMTAIPSYEMELDFRNEIQDDFVGFDVTLNKERFSELVRLLEEKSVDSVWLRVSRVSGIYSEWSPSISTRFAKILSNSHEVEGIKEDSFQPKVVENVGEFELNFATLNKLHLKQHLLPVDIEKEFEEPSSDEWINEPELTPAYTNQGDEKLLHSAALLAKLAGSLKTPLWFIFGVLVLLLLK